MTDLFRAEAVIARRDLAGPGRLLGRERFGRWWVLLGACACGGVAAALAVPVPTYRAHAASGHHRVLVRTGSEPLLRFLWREAT